jgi:phage tail sheath protein FI
MDIPSYTDGDVRIFTSDDFRPNVAKTRDRLDRRSIDNSYAATYFPDVTITDDRNGNAVRVPASVIALSALGFNDAVSYPWFAPAGFNRAALSNVVNVATRLNNADRDDLYDSRINPIASFPRAGFVIFGQKTLQQAKSALDRVNVRRMLLEVKRIVSNVAKKLVFEQNTPATRSKFIAQVTPMLATIQSQQGVDRFRIVMDESNNTVEDIESNKLNGRIVLVPTRAIEFISIDFIITNSGVSFE